MAKCYRKVSSLAEVGALQIKTTMQNYIDNPNGDVPLTVENVWYFEFLLRSRCAHVLLRKAKLVNRFLYKKYFYWVCCFKISFHDNVNQMSQSTRDHMWKCGKSKYLTNSVKKTLK